MHEANSGHAVACCYTSVIAVCSAAGVDGRPREGSELCHWHVEAERYNKFAILLKMGLFCLLEYEMVRFINTTSRYCFVSVKDCAQDSHILHKLNPGQSVLVLSPKSKHNFKASDTCTGERLIFDFLKTPTNLERVCRIETRMEKLKDLTLKILSQRYSRFPDRIEELRLPTQLKRELYFLTIPEPAEESVHTFCHVCGERLPKVLGCNPVALCGAPAAKEAWLSKDFVTYLRKFSNDLNDYHSTRDCLFDMFADLAQPSTNV
ncbi:hypothetical protein EVAR_54807_1 [Eumeta japonica]|uniref:Uncharacterized protein n=1 Tax=Eumeta variegata TaxID=151549 RepID=A0A4C1Y0I9_EUMVA|nr:hypothetical protein EVAR_54807_1 [Eumeta japonica]